MLTLCKNFLKARLHFGTGWPNRLHQPVGPTGWLTVYTLQPVVQPRCTTAVAQPECHAHANPTMTCSIVAIAVK